MLSRFDRRSPKTVQGLYVVAADSITFVVTGKSSTQAVTHALGINIFCLRYQESGANMNHVCKAALYRGRCVSKISIEVICGYFVSPQTYFPVAYLPYRLQMGKKSTTTCLLFVTTIPQLFSRSLSLTGVFDSLGRAKGGCCSTCVLM